MMFKVKIVKTATALLMTAVTAVIVSSCDTAGSATWSKSYVSGDQSMPYQIAQARDSGFLVLTESGLLKIDKAGAMLWGRQAGDGFYLESFAETGSGDIIGSYHQFSTTLNCWSLLKLNSEGKLIWNRSYGDRMIDMVAIDSSGQFLFALGRMDSRYPLMVMKVSVDDGSVMWARDIRVTRGPNQNLTATSDGGCIVATNDYTSYDPHLVKLGPGGELLWSRAYACTGGSLDLPYPQYSTHEMTAMSGTSDGGCIMAGFASREKDVIVWATRLDAGGNPHWSRELRGIIPASMNNQYKLNEYISYRPVSIIQTQDGGFALAGHSSRNTTYRYMNSYYDIYYRKSGWIMRLDSGGGLSWGKEYLDSSITGVPVYDNGDDRAAGFYTTTTNSVYFRSMDATVDNGFAIAGQIHVIDLTYGAHTDCLVLKTDENGAVAGTGLKVKDTAAMAGVLGTNVRDVSPDVLDSAVSADDATAAPVDVVFRARTI